MNPRISTRLLRSCSAAGHPPRAFTLVELLVVITIIAMLAGLLLPAIMSARESGRRATCMNNQKQIGTAIQNYVTAKDQFPPSFSVQPGIPAGQPQVGVGWVPPLLAYMEQNPLYQAYQNNTLTTGVIKDATINILVCPSGARGLTTPAPLSYVVNCGLPDTPPGSAKTNNVSMDYQENGVFFDQFSCNPIVTLSPPYGNNPSIPKVITDLTFVSRHDGTSTTLMFTENLDAMDWIALPASLADYAPPQPAGAHAGLAWWQGVLWDIPKNPASPPTPTTLLTLIHPPAPQPDAGTLTASMMNNNNELVEMAAPMYPYVSRPSSKHPGGFLVTMCDGHTQFMRDDVDYRVYCMIMAPDNTNAKYTIWFTKPLLGTPIVYPGTFNSMGTPAPAAGVGAIPLNPLTDSDLK